MIQFDESTELHVYCLVKNLTSGITHALLRIVHIIALAIHALSYARSDETDVSEMSFRTKFDGQS